MLLLQDWTKTWAWTGGNWRRGNPPRFLWSLGSFTRNQSEFSAGRNCEIIVPCANSLQALAWTTHVMSSWCHLKISYKNLYPLYRMLFLIFSSLDFDGSRPKVDAWSFSSCILMWTSNMCHVFTSISKRKGTHTHTNFREKTQPINHSHMLHGTDGIFSDQFGWCLWISCR